MSQENLALPPNADPILPSMFSTEIQRHVQKNLEHLPGVNSAIADKLSERANMNSLQVQNRPEGNPVLVSDYLRVRADTTLTLHPLVCDIVPQKHHDALIDSLVNSYHGHFIETQDSLHKLEPLPNYPEPVLNGLSEEFDLAYRHPKLELPNVEECSGNDGHQPSDYPIQIHDILADLRAEGIVTNLAASGCEKCGHEYGIRYATKLRSEGITVHGYVGISANSPPENPRISVQDCDESSWSTGDVVDLVSKSAHDHQFRSNLRVRKAGMLRQ
jgi:hypothetical protein